MAWADSGGTDAEQGGGLAHEERRTDDGGAAALVTEEPASRSRWRPSMLLTWYARCVVWLRWWVIAFWVAAVAAAVLYLPAVGQGGSDLGQLVATDNPSVQSEIRSFDKFGFPLLSRVAVVQRNPNGLSVATQPKP